MKTKIKILIPIIILETIENDAKFFGYSKERLCNEVLGKFSLKYRSNYQNELYFEKREYFQFNLNKANQKYYPELLKNNSEFKEAEILREIFLSYALFHPCLREVYLNREKIAFINNSIKEYRILKIGTEDGIVEGRIAELFRCKEQGYLKILIEDEEYYISKIWIIG